MMPPHRGVHHRDGRGPLLNAVLARGHRTVRIRPDQRAVVKKASSRSHSHTGTLHFGTSNTVDGRSGSSRATLYS